jgi:hypothetical protein
MDEVRKAYAILAGNLFGKDHLGDPFIERTKTLRVSKWNSECGCGPGSVDLRHELLASSWESGNDLSDSIKRIEFLDTFNDFELLKDSSDSTKKTKLPTYNTN